MARKATQIEAWSFSRYADYKLCPLKAKLKFIEKIAEPGNEAMERGSQIHRTAEMYIKGDIPRMPKELKPLADTFKMLKKLFKKDPDAMVCEDTWAFRSDWSLTRWDDWTGCWLRVKVDCAHFEDKAGKTLIVTDWKTGKFRAYNINDYVEQMELYALAAFKAFPDIHCVKPRLAYIDEGKFYPEVESEAEDLIFYRDEDEDRLEKLWKTRTKAMFKDKRFPANPNDKCVWCHYSRNNRDKGGGQCKY